MASTRETTARIHQTEWAHRAGAMATRRAASGGKWSEFGRTCSLP